MCRKIIVSEKLTNKFTNLSEKGALLQLTRDRQGRDRMVVGSTTTYSISAYHH